MAGNAAARNRAAVITTPSGRRVTALTLTATLTAAAAYGLIVLGATVRVTDSGMGCPDWPLCDGKIGPLRDAHARLEQSHRYLVAVVTLLVLITATLAWRQRRHRPDVGMLMGTAIVALTTQATLGAITVWTYNAAVTVGLHLAVGMILLGLLVAAAVRSYGPAPSVANARSGRPAPLIRTALIAVFFVVVSGTVLANAGADDACKAWPWCPRAAAPAHLVAVHLVHRAIVGAAVILLSVVAVQWWRRRVSRWLVIVLLAGLGAQAAVGAWTSISGTATSEALHVALAAGVWCVVVVMTASSYVSRVALSREAPAELLAA